MGEYVLVNISIMGQKGNKCPFDEIYLIKVGKELL